MSELNIDISRLTDTELEAMRKQYPIVSTLLFTRKELESPNSVVISQSFYDQLESKGYNMTDYRVNKPLI
jgi:hypothetical protein